VTVSTAGEPFEAFVPAPLPPEPPLAWSTDLRRRFDDALLGLGRLDPLTALLPNASLLLSVFEHRALHERRWSSLHFWSGAPQLRG
jgi:hypothetical protein